MTNDEAKRLLPGEPVWYMRPTANGDRFRVLCEFVRFDGPASPRRLWPICVVRWRGAPCTLTAASLEPVDVVTRLGLAAVAAKVGDDAPRGDHRGLRSDY